MVTIHGAPELVKLCSLLLIDNATETLLLVVGTKQTILWVL